MADHPTDLPDAVVMKLAALAKEHGYGIVAITLSWVPLDLRIPYAPRVEYRTEAVESVDLSGNLTRDGEL